MKYVLFVIDGVADYALDELGGKTPLEAANAPTLHHICASGTVGTALTIPPGATAGTDAALLTVMGAEVNGPMSRAHLEAAGFGILVPEGYSGLRMNLTTVENGVMISHCGCDITNDEAKELVNAIIADEELSHALADMDWKIYLGEGFRHILTIPGEPFSAMPPHQINGQKVAPYLQTGAKGEMLAKISAFMDAHRVNKARRSRGFGAANCAWPWGGGTRPVVPNFEQTFGIRGCVVGAVPVARGIGTLAGLYAPTVPGATGDIHTDYRAKANTAIELLSGEYDFAFVHFEAPDEAAHAGNVREKIEAIGMADEMARLLIEGLEQLGDYSIMLLSDHYTSSITRGHLPDPAPFCLMKKGAGDFPASGKPYTERCANESGVAVKGGELLGMLMNI